MTKLTTYEELKANIGKRVIVQKGDETYSGVITKSKLYDGDIEVKAKLISFINRYGNFEIAKDISSIELIEEDNQESPAGSINVINEDEKLIQSLNFI